MRRPLGTGRGPLLHQHNIVCMIADFNGYMYHILRECEKKGNEKEGVKGEYTPVFLISNREHQNKEDKSLCPLKK